MAIFCQIIAGLFCLHVAYPAEPQLTLKVATNGLGGMVRIEGKGWTAEQITTDVLNRFNHEAPGAKRACVQDACVDFRRTCNQVDGKVGCLYEVDAGLLSTFSVDADNSDAMQRARHIIALYRGDKRQSDFPLALLDETADKPNP